MDLLRRRTLDIRWFRKPRYRKCVFIGSIVLCINVFLVCSLVNSYRDPSLEEDDPSGRGRYHAEAGSLQGDDDSNNNNINNDNVFIKQKKLHIEREMKLLKHKTVPDSPVKSYVNSNKLNSAIGSTNGTILKLKELDFVPWCEVSTKEAVSAIHRAKTQLCKQELMNVTCLGYKGQLYPRNLTSNCPAPGVTAGKSLGCYQDDKALRLLTGYFTNLEQSNSPENCINLCLQSGFPYAGVEFWTECFCGVDEPAAKARLPDSSCNMKCPPDPHLVCGGYLTINIYQTGILKFTPQVPVPGIAGGEPKVRITYLLTLSGRALRQVKRLLKALYHKDHYFFIHVDARQDYLFRELVYLEGILPNVRLMRNRQATMWAGASLLHTLLMAMKEILELPWQWDFIINLSESDFPIKTNDQLVEFLSTNRGRNFVKSTGREIQRFIQKQGLDKTFVECDGHMWRVGDRKLPHGIQMDGGSDWMTLSRPFVEYVTSTERDQLLQGLDRVYKYTLLPAESYFHTVLRNSGFCDTYIDNNLHLTNWKRHLGCKCQYKHIVDWCGCSPNDFKPDDWPRIEATTANQLFFARKFEPVINQAVINKVSDWLYGSPKSSMAQLDYWQSMYHVADLTPPRDDMTITLLSSLTRLAGRQLFRSRSPAGIRDHDFTSLSSYHHDDAFKGLLLTHKGQSSGKLFQLESWFKITSHFRLVDETNGKFLQNVVVSSDFDLKESTSRSLLGSLGPLSDAVVVCVATPDKPSNITFLIVDPAGQLAQVLDLALQESAGKPHVSSSKVQILTPLLPGVWSVHVYHDGFLLAETEFLVTPLQVIAGSPLTSQQASLLHRGSPEYRLQADKEHWTKALPADLTKHSIALANQKRVGRDLEKWIDSLTQQFYTAVETCHVTDAVPLVQHEVSLEPCVGTVWSSYSPDPKSSISSFNSAFGTFS